MSESTLSPESHPEPIHELLRALEPVLARVAELVAERDLADPDAVERALELAFPYASAPIQAIGRLLARGVADSWLADRGAPESRYSRVAKPSPATHGLSIDVVSMIGAAIEHTHPRGEVTLGFAADPQAPPESCHFEARPPGWVVLPPGSRHVPTVTGARMNLVYFLPSGAVEWHF